MRQWYLYHKTVGDKRAKASVTVKGELCESSELTEATVVERTVAKKRSARSLKSKGSRGTMLAVDIAGNPLGAFRGLGSINLLIRASVVKEAMNQSSRVHRQAIRANRGVIFRPVPSLCNCSKYGTKAARCCIGKGSTDISAKDVLALWHQKFETRGATEE